MKQKHKIMPIVTLFVALILVLLIYVSYNYLIKNIYRKEYVDVVEKYSQQYNVEENLIYAIIKTESNFNISAKSNQNAIGLMQLMEPTAKEVAVKNEIDVDGEDMEEDLKNAEINIEIGVIYIGELLSRYENMYVALAAYNAGIGTVDNWIEKGIIKKDGSDIENIPYNETNNYVRKVNTAYEMYNKLY